MAAVKRNTIDTPSAPSTPRGHNAFHVAFMLHGAAVCNRRPLKTLGNIWCNTARHERGGKIAKCLISLASPAGFEPATCGLEIRCCYPAELRGRVTIQAVSISALVPHPNIDTALPPYYPP